MLIFYFCNIILLIPGPFIYPPIFGPFISTPIPGISIFDFLISIPVSILGP